MYGLESHLQERVKTGRTVVNTPKNLRASFHMVKGVKKITAIAKRSTESRAMPIAERKAYLCQSLKRIRPRSTLPRTFTRLCKP